MSTDTEELSAEARRITEALEAARGTAPIQLEWGQIAPEALAAEIRAGTVRGRNFVAETLRGETNRGRRVPVRPYSFFGQVRRFFG